MSNHYFLTAALLVLVTACAMEGRDGARTTCGSDYHCARNLMFQYRQQATELHALADRYVHEANIKSQDLGPDSDAAKKSLEMARRFSLRAQEADQLAHDYQQELPHNVY